MGLFDGSGFLGLGLGALTGAISNTTANINPDVATPVMPTADQQSITNLEAMQKPGAIDNFEFSNKPAMGLGMDPKVSTAISPDAAKANPTAPGTEGTSSGIDWMDTVGVLGKLYEGYKNDKRADIALNSNITDKKNSIRRASSVQNQMTGGKKPLAAQDEYEYV